MGEIRWATGRRLGWAAMPAPVQEWVDGVVGPVTVIAEHEGGMSPGCAVSLLAEGGERVFVKAVSAALNAETTTLFRDEAAVLRGLPAAPYRPQLRAVLDDGEWVGIMLEHVDGRYPDLALDSDAGAVAAMLATQSAALTPPPAGIDVPVIAERIDRWLSRWDDMAAAPRRYLPEWAAADFAQLHGRAGALPDRLPVTTLCHFDVRADNLFIRPDGSAVVLDWGRPHRGPAWTDLAMLAGQRPPAAAERSLRGWVPAEDFDTAVDLLLVLAGQEAWWGQQAPPPGLPTLPDFSRQDAVRLFGVLEPLLR